MENDVKMATRGKGVKLGKRIKLLRTGFNDVVL